MTGTMWRRELHATETRERILHEAMALFIQQGFTATTADEIAERAEVSQRTFFRYFASKEALLFHDFDERVASIQEAIERRPADEAPGESLVAVLCSMVDEIEQTPEQRALMVRMITERPELLAYQRSVLSERSGPAIADALALRAGLAPGDLGVRAVVGAVVACFELALRLWIEDDVRRPFEPTFRATLAACAAAFPIG